MHRHECVISTRHGMNVGGVALGGWVNTTAAPSKEVPHDEAVGARSENIPTQLYRILHNVVGSDRAITGRAKCLREYKLVQLVFMPNLGR